MDGNSERSQIYSTVLNGINNKKKSITIYKSGLN